LSRREKRAMFYVRMHDRYLSGWGAARDARNVLVVECETIEEAEAIRDAALMRPEMRAVRIVSTRPRSRVGVVYSWRTFADMGGPWRAYYRAGRTAA